MENYKLLREFKENSSTYVERPLFNGAISFSKNVIFFKYRVKRKVVHNLREMPYFALIKKREKMTGLLNNCHDLKTFWHRVTT